MNFLCINRGRPNTFISCGNDKSLRCWDLLTGAALKKIVIKNEIKCAAELNAQEICIADGNIVRIFNLITWKYKKMQATYTSNNNNCYISHLISLNSDTFATVEEESEKKNHLFLNENNKKFGLFQ